MQTKAKADWKMKIQKTEIKLRKNIKKGKVCLSELIKLTE